MKSSSPLTHQNSHHFRYQLTTDKAFLGALTRAADALEQVDIEPISEVEFLDLLAKDYPSFYECLDWVTFYRFDWKDKKKHLSRFYHLAVVNLKPDPNVREEFFESRVEITKRTGWYPRIHGSRANFGGWKFLYNRSLDQSSKAREISSLGVLQRLVPISSNEEEGNSFLLVGSQSKLLLDCGFSYPKTEPDFYNAVFVSHYHQDHAGGLWHYLHNSDVPVILSRIAMNYLGSQKRRNEQLQLISRAICADDISTIDLSEGGKVDFFPVFHCPGAYGIRIQDTKGNVFVYFGDICLRNGFNDFSYEAEQIVLGLGGNPWVLLDATLVGRPEKEISDGISLEKAINGLVQRQHQDNIILVSDRPETLLYSYLRTFILASVSQRPIKLFVNKNMYHVLQVLWKPVVFRSFETTDHVVRSIGGNIRNNFAESHRLYPLEEDVVRKVDKGEPCIFFAGIADIAKSRSLQKRFKNGQVVLTGTLAIKETVPEVIQSASPKSLLPVFSSDWNFHTDEQELAQWIQRLSSYGARFILFHNYPNRLKRFIEKYNLDTNLVLPIGDEAIELTK